MGWFHIPRAIDKPRLRLFCFPYAGGNAAAFHAWPAGLPADVELRAIALPGRGFRLREPCFTRMQPLLDALEREITPLLTVPFAFFGHSMGGQVAFELAHRLLGVNKPTPVRVFISGRRAPTVPHRSRPVAELDDRELLGAIRGYHNISDTMSRDLQDLVLPSLRADLDLLAHLDPWSGARLPVPITAFAGDRDTIASVADVDAWRYQTGAAFDLHVFSGDHFFINGAQLEVLATISAQL